MMTREHMGQTLAECDCPCPPQCEGVGGCIAYAPFDPTEHFEDDERVRMLRNVSSNAWELARASGPVDADRLALAIIQEARALLSPAARERLIGGHVRIHNTALDAAIGRCDPSNYRGHHAAVRRRCQAAIKELKVQS